MRILHLANHCHEIGNGIMNVAVDLACEQARMGHAVAFGSAGGSYVDLLEKQGVRHYAIRQHWRKPAAALAGFFSLRQLMRALAPDVVHAHMMAGALMARALTPVGDFVLVTSVHNEWQRSAIAMGVGDVVIGVSDAVRDAMALRGVDWKKLRTVRNGPLGSPRRANVSGAPAPTLERPAILTVCGMYRRKGVGDLIEAFGALSGRYPAARLYLAGDGPDRLAFEAQAARLPCAGRIHFLGFVPEPRPLLAQADIFALASHNEPFGLVLAEAREAGCAIVATAVGGIPEVLENGEAGLLTSPNNPAALATALDHLLANDAARREFQRRATQNIEWLSCARMAAETASVYREARECQQLVRKSGPLLARIFSHH